MRRLRIAAKECNYQELDSQVKEQIIHGMHDDTILIEIRSVLKAMKIQAKL